jgi:hypothetical protein
MDPLSNYTPEEHDRALTRLAEDVAQVLFPHISAPAPPEGQVPTIHVPEYGYIDPADLPEILGALYQCSGFFGVRPEAHGDMHRVVEAALAKIRREGQP